MKVLERRNTKQREIILKALQGNYTHPTANNVYDIVKKQNPEISISTVYRNLDILAENEQILKLFVSNEKSAHFDFQTHQHYHIKCTKCGKIEDLTFSKLNLKEEVSNRTGFKDISCHIDFTGVCKSCLGNTYEKKITKTYNNGKQNAK